MLTQTKTQLDLQDELIMRPATMVNPSFSKWAMMLPTLPLATESGLMIVKVRCVIESSVKYEP